MRIVHFQLFNIEKKKTITYKRCKVSRSKRYGQQNCIKRNRFSKTFDVFVEIESHILCVRLAPIVREDSIEVICYL